MKALVQDVENWCTSQSITTEQQLKAHVIENEIKVAKVITTQLHTVKDRRSSYCSELKSQPDSNLSLWALLIGASESH